MVRLAFDTRERRDLALRTIVIMIVEDHAGGSARFGVQTFAEYLNEIQASGSGL